MKRCQLGAVLGLAGLLTWTTFAQGQPAPPTPPAGAKPAPAPDDEPPLPPPPAPPPAAKPPPPTAQPDGPPPAVKPPPPVPDGPLPAAPPPPPDDEAAPPAKPPAAPGAPPPAAGLYYLPPKPPPAPPQTDSKLGSGISMAILGGLVIAIGTVAYVDGSTEAPLEYTCYYPPDYASCHGVRDKELMTAGVGMLTGGISGALLGLSLVWADTYDKKPMPHVSDAMMAAGIVLTTVGGAGVIGSSASWLYGSYEDPDSMFPAAISFWSSALLLSLGTPLWINGAGALYRDHPYNMQIAAGTPEDDYVMRSPAMMMAGLGLTLTGATLTALTIGAAVDQTGKSGRTPFTMTFGNIFALGTLFATGLPLAVIGGTEVPPTEAYARGDDPTRWLPELSVGAGAATLRWTY